MTECLGIHKSICDIKRAIAKGGGIQKDRSAPMGYKFRGIEDFDNILCGLTAEHGVIMYPRVTNREVLHGTTAKGSYQSHVFLTIDWTFVCSLDGSREVVTTCGEAMDTQDKAINKAMQASRKYAILMVLMIPTAGDDTEIYVPEPASPVAAPLAVAATPAADPIAAQVTNGALLPVVPAEPKPAPRQGKPGVRGPNKPKPVAAPAEITHPAEVLNGTAPPTPAMDFLVEGTRPPEMSEGALLGAIGEAMSFPLLFAIASDADKEQEPYRAELMTAVKHRAVLLFADAKDMAGVREGFELVKAMGSPDELKHAANNAYGRFRNKP